MSAFLSGNGGSGNSGSGNVGPKQAPDAASVVAPGGPNLDAALPLTNKQSPATYNGFRPSDFTHPLPSRGA